MSSHPLVSVVIPTFNQCALLLETLQSVWCQTLGDFEVVIINDGSSDGTINALSAIVDRRLRIVTQENQGIGAARNRGLLEARGKYIATLDHDDLWQPEKLAKQVACLEGNPDWFSVSSPYSRSTSPNESIFDLPVEDCGETLVSRPIRELRRSTFITTSSMMYRRKEGVELRYGEERGATEDLEFYIQLFHQGPIGIAGKEILVIYRVHDTNFSKQVSYHEAGLTRLRRLFRDGEFSYLQSEEFEDWQELLAHVARVIAVMQINSDRKVEGCKTYVREFADQLSRGRIKFLAAYPLMLLLPKVLRNSIKR